MRWFTKLSFLEKFVAIVFLITASTIPIIVIGMNLPQPKIDITSSTRSESENYVFTADIKHAKQRSLFLGNKLIEMNCEKDTCRAEVTLIHRPSKLTVHAKNLWGKKSETITVFRPENDAEKAQRLQMEAELVAAEQEKQRQKEAEEREWKTSKAGQICERNPSWSRGDCILIANDKIWIGMHLDMLKERRGQPSSANPSDYGFGITWQWCWFNYSPSCFYGDDDGIIDSYN